MCIRLSEKAIKKLITPELHRTAMYRHGGGISFKLLVGVAHDNDDNETRPRIQPTARGHDSFLVIDTMGVQLQQMSQQETNWITLSEVLLMHHDIDWDHSARILFRSVWCQWVCISALWKRILLSPGQSVLDSTM